MWIYHPKSGLVAPKEQVDIHSLPGAFYEFDSEPTGEQLSEALIHFQNNLL